MEKIVISQQELDDLPEYSCSIPTGVVVGKRWKRAKNYYDRSKGWVVGEYCEDNPDKDVIAENKKPNKIIIKWFEPTNKNNVIFDWEV